MSLRDKILLGYALAPVGDLHPGLAMYARADVERMRERERLLVELRFLRQILGLPRNCDRGLTLDQLEDLAARMKRGERTERFASRSSWSPL